MKSVWERIQFKDRRLVLASALPAVLFSLLTVFGRELQQFGAFRALNAFDILKMMSAIVLLALVYFFVLLMLFSFFDFQASKEGKNETLFSKITGNGFVVFIILLIGWIPVWLAFWPGHFSADSLTQFYSYYNEEPYAHHPLLHTALLGACMMFGIDLHPEGCATYGLAIYCGVQMVLLAGCIAYGVWWLKRREVPAWMRVIITLLFAFGPFYAPWPFCAQKDVLFAALATVFCLQLVDLWRYGMKIPRVISFVVIALLMMLLRNNGVYALVLLIPAGIVLAKRGMRVKTALILCISAALYLGINHTMISASITEIMV